MQCLRESVARALIARVVFAASLFPTQMSSNHESLACLDLGGASSDLPLLAKMFIAHKNLTIIWHCDTGTLAFSLVLAFATFSAKLTLRIGSIGLRV